MKKRECFLANKIKHEPKREIDKKLLETSRACFLKPIKDTSNASDSYPDGYSHVTMNRPTKICGVCCLRISQMLDERAALLRDGSVSPELLQYDPSSFISLLSPISRQYAQVLIAVGVDISMVSQNCTMCNAQDYNQMVAEAAGRARQGMVKIENELHTR